MDQKRKAREIIISFLFAGEFYSEPHNEKSYPLVPSGLSDAWLADKPKKTVDYINQMVQGVKKNRKNIDKMIEKNSHSWKIKRISLMDLSIMRLALYEMFYAKPPLPFKVCIDEALEIAKIYSTEDSASFINGNLDTIYKTHKNSNT